MRDSSFLKLALPLLLVLALPLTDASLALAGEKGTWTFVTEEDAIRVWKLDIPGQDLPGFRGQTVIKGSIDDIMKQMMDSAHHTDWMYRCKESRVLKTYDETRSIVYNRTGAPWPVWDRDVVLEVTYAYNADRTQLTMSFHDVPNSKTKTPDGVVRMPRLVGSYKMQQLGPKQTKITYEVEADIGGSIPTFIAKQAAKDMPYLTLSRLRARVEGTEI
jgi:hypothetical protein